MAGAGVLGRDRRAGEGNGCDQRRSRVKAQALTAARRGTLEAAWAAEMEAAGSARAIGDATAEWQHLERAHILSQPIAGPHVRTHAAMLTAAFRRRDWHEVAGQAFRLAVAGPGSLTGKYPVGNTGGADVSAFEPMPIPEDLAALLGEIAGPEQT
jgi:hypothetical protein